MIKTKTYVVFDWDDPRNDYQFYTYKEDAIDSVRRLVAAKREKVLEKIDIYECIPIKLGIVKYVEEIEEIANEQ